MGELILEVLILFLFRYPGTYVRWALSGFKGTFRHRLEKDDAYFNAALGLVAIFALIVLVEMFTVMMK
jgi:hypothetical protein